MATSKLSSILNHIGPTADPQSHLWTLRISPVVALSCVLLSQFVWKYGSAHGLCLGLGTGQLFILWFASLRIKGVIYDDPQDSTLQQLHLSK